MSSNQEQIKKVVVIGGGPGGYRAAFRANDLGMDVTLVDPEDNPGGECLYRGCIPTKALLHLVKIKQSAEEGKEMGMYFDSPRIEHKEITDWKNKVVRQLTGGLGQLVKTRKINYLKGYARFVNNRLLEFDNQEGKKQQIEADYIVIATGTVPVELKELSVDDQWVMGSEGALDMKDIPDHLLIVGGGYIGLEMAAIYRGLGSKVSIAELTDGFLQGTDRDLVREYNKYTRDQFEEIFLNTSVSNIKKEQGKVRVNFSEKGGKDFTRKYNKILVAVGQKPNHSSLSIEKAGVETDEKGFIRVDEQQRTSIKNIFAIGDVTCGPLLAHKAMYEGAVAAEALAGRSTIYDARVIPSVIYTRPEIAVCGLSETQAKEMDIKYKAVKFPWSASGRAIAMGEGKGFTKMLLDPETGRILGAGIVGADAGELISEFGLAIEMAGTAEDIALTIHPHPTLSETIMETAEIFLDRPVHIFSKKQKSK